MVVRYFVHGEYPVGNTAIGSIPERDETDKKLYNTSTVYSPAGWCAFR